MRIFILLGLIILSALAAPPAQAEFIISSAILDFAPGDPPQKDIELISRGRDSDYIVTEISEIIDAGLPAMRERKITDRLQAGLMVTPDKTVLASGGRRVVRFVLLREPDDKERIYHVTLKPVIKGVDTGEKLGLKILVGYKVLVIVRPREAAPAFGGQRHGRTINIRNTGNTNLLFQHGTQCARKGTCGPLTAARIHVGEKAALTLPQDAPATYTVWDGSRLTERHFP